MWAVRHQGPSWAEVRQGPQDGDILELPFYTMRRNCKEKAVFRKAWAKKELQNIVQKKIQIKSYQDAKASMGTYKPFAIMVRGEGGKEDSECLQAAKRIAAKRVALGGPWVHWNCMSERFELLHSEKQHNEIMQVSWQQYIEEGEETARPAPQSSPGPDQLPEQLPEQPAEQETLCCDYVCLYVLVCAL